MKFRGLSATITSGSIPAKAHSIDCIHIGNLSYTYIIAIQFMEVPAETDLSFGVNTNNRWKPYGRRVQAGYK